MVPWLITFEPACYQQRTCVCETYAPICIWCMAMWHWALTSKLFFRVQWLYVAFRFEVMTFRSEIIAFRLNTTHILMTSASLIMHRLSTDFLHSNDQGDWLKKYSGRQTTNRASLGMATWRELSVTGRPQWFADIPDISYRISTY